MASIMGEVGSEFHYFNLKESRTNAFYLLALSFTSN